MEDKNGKNTLHDMVQCFQKQAANKLYLKRNEITVERCEIISKTLNQLFNIAPKDDYDKVMTTNNCTNTNWKFTMISI